MTIMLTDIPVVTATVALVSGGIGGGLTTLGIAWVRSYRRRRAFPSIGSEPIDPFIDQQLAEAATQWAAVQQQPHGQDVIARKLRLAYRLARRRQARRWSQ